MKENTTNTAELFKYDQWVALTLTVLASLWFTHPMWSSDSIVFAGKLATDNVVTPWFYDFVSRSLLEGESYSLLRGFDFPNPHPRDVEFPALTDAVLAAPIGWVFDWPQQWGVVLSIAVCINAVSLQTLARAVGIGALGTLVAGLSGVLLRPVWVDLLMGRMNVATPGYAVLALAFVLFAFPNTPQKTSRPFWVQLTCAVLAAFFGGLAALTYPPFLALMIAVGIVPILFAVWRGGFRGMILPILSTGGCLWWVYGTLESMWFDQYRELDCNNVLCPDRYNAVAWNDLFLWEAEKLQGLSYSGIQAAFWFSIPLVLFHKKLRWVGILLSIVAISYGALSLGPCPRLTPLENLDASWVPLLKDLAGPIWCQATHLHDFGRFATVCSIVLALLSGVAVDALASHRFRIRKCIGVFFGGWILYMAGTPLWAEYMDYNKWHEIPESPIVIFLNDKEPRNIVEFPYDRSGQFLSALGAPTHNRMNPVRPTDPPRSELIFYQWAYKVGRGLKPDVTPDQMDISKANMHYVFFDPSRCYGGGMKDTKCDDWVIQHITEVFGEPILMKKDILRWELNP